MKIYSPVVFSEICFQRSGEGGGGCLLFEFNSFCLELYLESIIYGGNNQGL